jgi:hypothetical protein
MLVRDLAHPSNSAKILASEDCARMTTHDAPARTVRLVARAVCRFADGSEQRLWASRISLSDAWILAVEPPRVGEQIELSLHPLGLAPLPALRARVMKAQIDFAAAEKNGFEVAFIDVQDDTLDQLVSAIIGIDELRAKAPAFAERRGALRVKTNIAARARTSGGLYDGVAADLSLTGALLSLPREVSEAATARGSAIRLTLALSDAREPLDIAARIAWTTAAPGQRLVGVQFEDLNASARMRIQDTILQALTSAP